MVPADDLGADAVRQLRVGPAPITAASVIPTEDELSAINRSNTDLLVPPPGVEPGTCGLKVRSSTN